jgi:hypothetical protein
MDMKTDRLRSYNVVMGALHAVQGVAVMALANDFALPVTATFMEDAPGAAPPELRTLFEVRFAWWVAAFLFLSAAAHWIIASPKVYEWYRENLKRERNYARWIEYSVSSSIMIVLIAMLTGISEVTAIGALFAVNATMILFGLLQEHYESPGNGRWLPYWFGVFAGAVPWLLIGVYLVSPGIAAQPPTFVYVIFISLFIFFNSFALNMVLQYRKKGKWADYLYGEKVYVFLSLTAKSLLAWQVFGGTLAA